MVAILLIYNKLNIIKITFSRFLFEVKSKHFHQYTPLARQDKGKKYFAIYDTHRGLVVQISPNMLSGIIYAGMQI